MFDPVTAVLPQKCSQTSDPTVQRHKKCQALCRYMPTILFFQDFLSEITVIQSISQYFFSRSQRIIVNQNRGDLIRVFFQRLLPKIISRNASQAEALREKNPEAIQSFQRQINSNPFRSNRLRIELRYDVRLGYKRTLGVYLGNNCWSRNT